MCLTTEQFIWVLIFWGMIVPLLIAGGIALLVRAMTGDSDGPQMSANPLSLNEAPGENEPGEN